MKSRIIREIKECRRCKQTKPSIGFGLRKASRDGLKSYCRTCESKAALEYSRRVKRVAIQHPVVIENKNCRSCRELKSASEFYRVKGYKDGLTGSCKRCVNAATVRHSRLNPEMARKRKSKWRLAHPDKVRESQRRRRLANPEVSRVVVRRRRARMAGGGNHTVEDIQELLARQGYECKVCGIDISRKYHVDHVVPIARGGSNWPSNLQILCPPCNHSKSAACMEEWLPRRLRQLGINTENIDQAVA